LSAGYDEELLTVYSFGDERFSKGYLGGYETFGYAAHNAFIDVGEEGDAAQTGCSEAGYAIEVFHLDAFGFLEFHLGTVDAEGSALYLCPGEQLEE
jgi:hypothetical protein